MMRTFKYDVIQLIESVRDRPCLWDRTLELYKDRFERRRAWEEVFSVLDGSYEEMTDEEKRMMGEYVLNKWTNVRDTFVKSLKTKMGKPKKKYVLYDHLKFLKKLSPTQEDSYHETDDIEAPTHMKIEMDSSEETRTRKRPKKIENKDSIKKEKINESDIDFAEVDVYNDPRVMNEDEAFFASLLPTVVNYTEDERLEFRIEVLALMKRIKEKRRWSTVSG